MEFKLIFVFFFSPNLAVSPAEFLLSMQNVQIRNFIPKANFFLTGMFS